MVNIGIAPLYMSESVLSIGADDYESNVSGVTLTPSTSTVQWKGLSANSAFTRTTKATWVCQLDYAQDWETANSLSLYLLAHEGDEVEAHFEPVDGGQGFDVTLIITPGAIGGSVDTVATGSVQLGVQGAPVLAA